MLRLRPSAGTLGAAPQGTKDHIRNFCIISRFDHGKSTLADRLIKEPEQEHGQSAVRVRAEMIRKAGIQCSV